MKNKNQRFLWLWGFFRCVSPLGTATPYFPFTSYLFLKAGRAPSGISQTHIFRSRTGKEVPLWFRPRKASACLPRGWAAMIGSSHSSLRVGTESQGSVKCTQLLGGLVCQQKERLLQGPGDSLH